MVVNQPLVAHGVSGQDVDDLMCWKARISCHYLPLPESEDMMGKPKLQHSFRLLLVEVLRRGKFLKNKREVTKLVSVCKLKFSLSHIMSAYTDNAVVHHGVLERGINYIQKPFALEGLARKVREVLDK